MVTNQPPLRDVLTHLESQLAQAPDAASKADLLASIGRLYEEALLQQDQALFHYKRALDYEPHSEKALDGQARIYALQQRWAELEEALRQAIAGASDRQRLARLTFQLATLYLDCLHKSDDGITALVRVLDLDPLNRAVYPLLDQLYQERRDWPAALENLSAWLDLTEDKATAVTIMNRIAEIGLDRLGQIDKAQQTLEEVLLLDAENVTAIRRLETLYRQRRNWEALAVILHRQASLLAFRHPQEQIRIGVDLGEIYAVHLHREDQAEGVLRRVLQMDPSHPRARALLVKLLEAKANWVEVVQVCRADLDLITDSKVKAQKLLHMADITEKHLDKASDSTPLYAEAYRLLQESPSPDEVLLDTVGRHLLRRWGDEGRTQDLIAFHRDRVSRTRSLLEKADALKNLVLLHDGQAALRYSRELLELSEHLGRDYQSDYSRFALKKLAPIYLSQENWSDLVATYERLLQVTEETNERAMLYFRMAEIQNHKLNLMDEAVDLYAKALENNPSLTPALRARREVLVRLGRTQEAISLFQVEISLTQGVKARSGLYSQLGCLREDYLKQPELAMRDFEQAIELDSENQAALKRLAVHYYQSEQWQKADPLFEKLSHLSDVATEGADAVDPLKKAAFWARRARIAEHLDRLEDATQYLYKALEYNPSFVPALEQLADLYQRTHQWQEARRYYTDFIRLVETSPVHSTDSLKNIHLNLARIEERLENGEEAAANYRKVLELEPLNRPALEAMINIDLQAGRFLEVQGYYDLLLRMSPSAEDWLTVQFAKAELWEHRLGRPKNAISCYQAILEKDPLNHLTLERLAQLYCASGELVKGIGIFEQLLRGEPETDRRLQYLHSLGRIYRLGIKDLGAAEEQFRQILMLDPENLQALKEWVEILQEQGSWEDLTEAYGKIVALVSKSDPLMAIPFYLKMGNIQRVQLQKPERAIESYKRVIEIDEDNVAARNALVELYASHESFHEEAIRQHRKLLEGDPLRVTSYRALGQIYYHRKEFDKAFCLFKILDAMGETSPDERNFIHKCQAAMGQVLRSELSDSLRNEVLMHPGEKSLVSDLLKALRDPLRELFWDEALIEKSEEPFGPFARQMLETITQVSPVLQITAPRLRILKSTEQRLFPMGGFAPVIVAYSGFLSGNYSPAERFRLLRVMDSLVHAREFAWRLAPTQLERLFVVVLKSFFKEISVGGYPEKDLKNDLKQFQRVFPKKLRPVLKDLVTQVARTWDQLDFAGWMQGVRLTGNRLALLLGGDFEAAVQVILEDERLESVLDKRQSAGLNRLGVFARSATLRDLLVFAASDDYCRLRMRIGRAVPPGKVQF